MRKLRDKIILYQKELFPLLKLGDLDKIKLTYCLLIHNKRQGEIGKVFYMTMDELIQASGLDAPMVKRLTEELVGIGIIEKFSKDKYIINLNYNS